MIFMRGAFSKYIQRALKRGDAMLDDSYGNRVSTNSIEATMSYSENAKDIKLVPKKIKVAKCSR